MEQHNRVMRIQECQVGCHHARERRPAEKPRCAARTRRYLFAGGGAAAAILVLAGTGAPLRAVAQTPPLARRYVGSIGGYPITMTLMRQGSRLSGSYRYTRAGVLLHLEGAWLDGTARLREIYGKRSHTATILARLGDDGSLFGTWTKTDGSQSLAFRAHPTTSPVAVSSDSSRTEIAPESKSRIKAHRRPASQSSARGTRPVVKLTRDSTLTTSDIAFLREIRRGNITAARALLDRGASPDAHGADGKTALMLACTFRNDASEATSFSSLEERQDFVRMLLARGVQVDAKDSRGYTAMMYAAASWGAGNPIIRLLLDAAADVNARNIYRGTALMVATGKYGHVSTVQLLIDAGADTDLKDKFGHTALWYARSHHSRASVRVLEQARAAE